MSLTATRIPYLRDCDGRRYDPITGCSNTGDQCAVRARNLCWAESLVRAEGVDNWRCRLEMPTFKPTFHPERLTAPLRTRRDYLIAVGFGGDMWSNGVVPDWRRQVCDVERQCPQHTFVHLTKCPENIRDEEILPNGWYGTSICVDADSDRIAPLYELMLRTDGHFWISFEPVLENLRHIDVIGFDWIVVGGLSDSRGRVIRPDEGGTRAEWIQSILDAVAHAGVPIYAKNLGGIWHELRRPRSGEWLKSPTELRELPREWSAG